MRRNPLRQHHDLGNTVSWQPLEARLDGLHRQNRERTLRDWTPGLRPGTVQVGGRTLLDLASNDYLGLARQVWTPERAAALLDGHLGAAEGGAADTAAVLSAMTRFGAGASRLITGNDPAYGVLERSVARLKGQQAALVFGSGVAANMGTIPALVGPGDAVFSDALNHASIIDGIRLSRARCHVYPHRDLDTLDAQLRVSAAPRKLIVTDALFSMDGTFAPLAELAALKRKYGAWLMVDEAHSGGVYGDLGAGLAQAAGVSGQIDVSMGTFGKAYGSVGAYIAGDAVLIRYLLNTARTLTFTTGLPPSSLAVSVLNLLLSQQMDSQRAALQTNAAAFRDQLTSSGADTAGSESQIVPLLTHDDVSALSHAASLQASGFGAVAIRPPTVPAGTARIRFALSAAHSWPDLQACLDAVPALNSGQFSRKSPLAGKR